MIPVFFAQLEEILLQCYKFPLGLDSNSYYLYNIVKKEKKRKNYNMKIFKMKKKKMKKKKKKNMKKLKKKIKIFLLIM